MSEALQQDITNKIHEVKGDLLPENTLIIEQVICSDVFLSKKLATINRVELLYMLGNYFDVHFAMYGSIEEAIDKSDFYLKHDPKREDIKRNVLEIMKKDHIYEIRLRKMLQTAGHDM